MVKQLPGRDGTPEAAGFTRGSLPVPAGPYFRALVILLAVLSLGCGIHIPQCVKDGSCLPITGQCPKGQEWCPAHGGGCVSPGGCHDVCASPNCDPCPAGRTWCATDDPNPWVSVGSCPVTGTPCLPPTTTTTTLPAPVPTPTPTPTPAPPPAGHGQDDREPDLHDVVLAEHGATTRASFAGDLQAAIDASCLNSCAAGDVVGDWERLVKAVRDALRAKGYGAGFDWAHGETGGLGSELSFWRDGHFEAHQIVTSARKLRRPPNSFTSKADYDAPVPVPECTLIVNADHPVNLKIAKRQGAAGARWLDLTPEYFYGVNEDGTGAGPCLDQNGNHRRWCDLGVDGGPTGPLCEAAIVGRPKWSTAEGTLQLSSPFNRGDGDNPFLAEIVSGTGTARVCNQNGSICGTVAVP